MSLKNLTEQEFAALVKRRDNDAIDAAVPRGGKPLQKAGLANHVKSASQYRYVAGVRSGADVKRSRGVHLGEGGTACITGIKSPAGSNPASSPFRSTLALTGQIPSGKNQVQLLWRNGKVHKYPNKTFTNWRAQAHGQILEQANWGQRTIITAPICLTCNYWPGDQRTRDVSGMLDALFHLLVYAKVLKDDGLIWSVWWRRHAVTKFPKVTMELENWT